MASSSSLLSEDQLQCPICLDVFTEPVSTPCGHNFCMICLRRVWNSSPYQCPVCKEEFQKRPELRVNTFISGLVASFKESIQEKTNNSAEETSTKPLVLCEVCTDTKQVAVKSCLICMTSYCSTHLEPHQRVPAFRNHKMIGPVENLKNYICQKHEKPLDMFCKDDQMPLCQFCTDADHRYHNTVTLEEESEKIKTQLLEKQADVEELIQERLKKIKEVKQSVELNKMNTKKEKSESMEIFRALILCIERKRAELLKVMEEKQKAAERQAAEFIKDLEQEITELKRRKTELEQISNIEEDFLQMYPSLCTPPPTNNWTDVNINPHLSADPLIRIRLQETFNETIEKLIKMELRSIRQYAEDVTLDPDTAHPQVILSADGKQMTYSSTPQNLYVYPQRFDWYFYALGKNGISSGRVYYEVEVRGKIEWVLGIISESSNRKGEFTHRPEDGYWCVWMHNVNEYIAYESPPVSLSLKAAPQKVGVFVDYEEGLISFYDVENKVHIYSFTHQSFTEKLYPAFNPGPDDYDEDNYDDDYYDDDYDDDDDHDNNSSPLIICLVNQD